MHYVKYKLNFSFEFLLGIAFKSGGKMLYEAPPAEPRLTVYWGLPVINFRNFHFGS